MEIVIKIASSDLKKKALEVIAVAGMTVVADVAAHFASKAIIKTIEKNKKETNEDQNTEDLD